MSLVNPFEQVVVFGKAYSLPADPASGTNVRVVSALKPTGRSVGTANNLVHVSNSKGRGGPTRLERFTKAGVSLPKLMQTTGAPPVKLGQLRARSATGVAQRLREQRFGSVGRRGSKMA
jgi:hypothetical protein